MVSMTPDRAVLREPAETVHAAELAVLAETDTGPRPQGWRGASNASMAACSNYASRRHLST